nr:ribonuclease H-like domain, reverse transcriptase, RNA-dependent DNA polymerase [Tanacetum cinerariifolium]
MVAILEKSEHNVEFHLIVDFVTASHIRYALTFNPTVYVSHIRQFLSTARIETTEEGTKIIVIVDGICSLPDAKLFENLTLMGYNISPNQKFTFQKGQFSHQWKYLIHTIMQCLSPKSIGFNKFSSNIATTLVYLATNRVYNFSKMIFDGEACLIVSGLEAEHDRANITKTSTLPHESTSRVTSLAAYEGCMQLRIQEFPSLCTSLQKQQTKLMSKFEAHEEDAPIKGKRMDEGEEAAKGVSDDTEVMAIVLTSMDAASILTSGGVQVVRTATAVATVTVSISTGSGVVPTASPTIPTASPIFATATVEEAERFKRERIRFEQESVKKLKTLEEVKATEEVTEEKVKEMIQLISVEEVYVEALQVKHPIIDWKVHTEGQRSYWKIIRLGGSSASYQFFVDMLKHLNREDLNQL